jgi:hypothetical protein
VCLPLPSLFCALLPVPFQTGKLATIVDIVDHNLALIDGPETITGVKRQVRSPRASTARPGARRAFRARRPARVLQLVPFFALSPSGD